MQIWGFQIHRQKTMEIVLGVYFVRNSNYVTLTIELVLHVASFPDYSFHACRERM